MTELRVLNLGAGVQSTTLYLMFLDHRTRRLELNLARRRKAAVYAHDYGPGGYQDRFKAIDQACTRVGR